jgi:molybdopterin converting factor small subunit
MNDIGNLLVIQGLLTDNLAQIFCGFYFIHSDARRNLERNTALANQLADTERRLAWHKNRVQYHSTARSLLSRAQSCVSENEAIAILNELNAMLAKFSANKSYLNANDNEFLDSASTAGEF